MRLLSLTDRLWDATRQGWSGVRVGSIRMRLALIGVILLVLACGAEPEPPTLAPAPPVAVPIPTDVSPSTPTPTLAPASVPIPTPEILPTVTPSYTAFVLPTPIGECNARPPSYGIRELEVLLELMEACKLSDKEAAALAGYHRGTRVLARVYHPDIFEDFGDRLAHQIDGPWHTIYWDHNPFTYVFTELRQLVTLHRVDGVWVELEFRHLPEYRISLSSHGRERNSSPGDWPSGFVAYPYDGGGRFIGTLPDVMAEFRREGQVSLAFLQSRNMECHARGDSLVVGVRLHPGNRPDFAAQLERWGASTIASEGDLVWTALPPRLIEEVAAQEAVADVQSDVCWSEAPPPTLDATIGVGCEGLSADLAVLHDRWAADPLAFDPVMLVQIRGNANDARQLLESLHLRPRTVGDMSTGYLVASMPVSQMCRVLASPVVTSVRRYLVSSGGPAPEVQPDSPAFLLAPPWIDVWSDRTLVERQTVRAEVGLTGLDPSEQYTVVLWTDDPGIGFDSTCERSLTEGVRPSSGQHYLNVPVFACGGAGGRVVAELRLGDPGSPEVRDVDRILYVGQQNINVLATDGPPLMVDPIADRVLSVGETQTIDLAQHIRGSTSGRAQSSNPNVVAAGLEPPYHGSQLQITAISQGRAFVHVETRNDFGEGPRPIIEVVVSAGPPTPPKDLRLYRTGREGWLALNYEQAHAYHNYWFELHQMQPNGLYSRVKVVSDVTPPAIFTDVPPGRYRAQGRNCQDGVGIRCSEWSAADPVEFR